MLFLTPPATGSPPVDAIPGQALLTVFAPSPQPATVERQTIAASVRSVREAEERVVVIVALLLRELDHAQPRLPHQVVAAVARDRERGRARAVVVRIGRRARRAVERERARAV